MDIQCPNCHVLYVFDDARIIGEQMQFKCSKCSHVFEVRIPQTEVEEAEPRDAIRIDMDYRLAHMEAEREEEAVAKEETEAQRETPDESPIIVEGIIGAAEAGLETGELPDIEIGEPAVRISPEGRISYRRKGMAWRLTPALLIGTLLVVAGVMGAYFARSTLDVLIPERVQRFFSGAQKSSVADLALMEVQGFFSRNSAVGYIYVVKGKVHNRGARPCTNIRVKGILHNRAGDPLMETEVICGIDIPDREIISLTGDELQSRMSVYPPREAALLKPSGTLPFTVIFLDLPKDIYEYSIRITGAEFPS